MKRISTELMAIADTYGFMSQSNQLVEEMAELTQALCKWNRMQGCGQMVSNINTIELWENICEEIADVQVVLSQIIYLMGNEETVEEIKQGKIERTLARMEKNKKFFSGSL